MKPASILRGQPPATASVSRAGRARLWAGGLVGLSLCLLLPTVVLAAGEADLAYAKGILAYKERDYLEALDRFRQAVELAPDNPNAQFYLGLSLSRIGEFAQAIAVLQTALRLDASLRYVHYHLGLAYIQEKRYAEAIGQFELAEQFDPEKAATHFYLGYAYYEMKNYRQAPPPLQRAVELDPTLALSVQYYRGLAFYALERDTAAREAFEEVVAIEPENILAQNAQRYLQALAQRALAGRLLHVEASLSVQYDDNVTIADDDIISRQSDGSTVYTFVGRLRPITSGPWLLGLEYTLFQTLHFELTEFDLQSHTGRLFTRFKLPRASLRLASDFTYTTLGNQHFSEAVTVEASANVKQTKNLFALVSVRYRDSRFPNQFLPPGQEAVRDRDGRSGQAGFAQYLLMNDQGAYLRLHYRFEESRNEGSDWEYDGHRVGVGLYTPLLWGITLDTGVAYERRNYLHVHSFSGDTSRLAVLDPTDTRKREDDRLAASLLFSRALERYLTFSASVVYTDNMSNISFFDYDRSVLTLSLTGRF